MTEERIVAAFVFCVVGLGLLVLLRLAISAWRERDPLSVALVAHSVFLATIVWFEAAAGVATLATLTILLFTVPR